MNDIEQRLIEIIEKIRPFLINDGGNIELVKYANKTAYIRLLGLCSECELVDFTMKEVIESTIKDEIPEIEHVIKVD